MFRGKSHHFPTAFAAEAMDFAAEILSGEVVPFPILIQVTGSVRKETLAEKDEHE